MTEEKYYSIKLIGATRGYTTPTTKGIILSENHAGVCHKFATVKEAREFIKKNKLENNRFKAYIRSSEEIEVEIAKNKALHGQMRGEFKIVNEKGENAHYSMKHKQYYFSKEELGCSAWHDKPSVRDFVTKIQGYFPQMKIKARKLK